MKLRCPRCQKKLAIPDKYAGKAVRCPSCHKPFNVPALTGDAGGRLSASRVDLEGLAGLERASSELDRRELAAAEQSVRDIRTASAAERGAKVRTCPNCRKETPVDDPYVEVLCSHCWNPIPALIEGARTSASAGMILDRTQGPAAFYAELAACITYPLPAVSSIGSAAAIAIAAALAPVAIMTALSFLMQQGDVGLAGGVRDPDLTNVQWMLVGIFALEILFFTLIAIHTFLDVIRASVIANKAPPKLGWGPAHWGRSLAGYLAIVVYLALMTGIVAFLTIPGDVDSMIQEIRKGNLLTLLQSGGSPLVAGVLLVSFGVPMNLLGLGLGSVVQAVNPVRVLKSIGRTHAHYVFLVVLLAVYGILFASAFTALIFEWFIPQVGDMVSGAAEGDVLRVAVSLIAWGVVMAFYFFGTYVLARMHGVFALSFRKKLEFGAM